MLAPLALAKAALVTWSFEGTVRDIENPGAIPSDIGSLGVGIGALVSGHVQMEMDTPPANPISPGTSTNVFGGAVLNAAVSVADWSLVQTTPGGVLVVGELDLGPGESIGAPMTDPNATSATIVLELSQNSALWDTTAMLASPPPLDELNPYGFHSFPSTYFINGTELAVELGAAQLHVELSSLLPEPHASLLALLAAFSLAARRRMARAA